MFTIMSPLQNIPLNAPTFGEDEIQLAIEVLKSGQLTMAHRCLEFEAAFEKALGTPNATFVNSGSSANLLAFFALTNPLCPKIANKKVCRPGGEVIVPAVTWSTTIWPIVQAGLVPVLVDSDPRTLQMDLSALKGAISDKTVAICPVHVLGNAVEMNPVLDLAKQHGLWVVEDTCEALGTEYLGRPVGTLGDIGTYSFFFSHHITTIEGGMVITPHNELAELFRCMRAHGWTRHLKNREKTEALYADIDPRFLFISTGFNLRPTEINAAFGIQQLKKLSGFNSRRQSVAMQWIESFGPLEKSGQLMPMQPNPGVNCTWFGFPVRCATREVRDKFKSFLESRKIETRPIICGNLARQPAFRSIQHRISGSLTGADEVMDKGLFWGSHPIMSEDEIQYVATTVREFFK
jgi:CDP-6-deoxy-D-xylo-4-hexulose-3-dehydrase